VADGAGQVEHVSIAICSYRCQGERVPSQGKPCFPEDVTAPERSRGFGWDCQTSVTQFTDYRRQRKGRLTPSGTGCPKKDEKNTDLLLGAEDCGADDRQVGCQGKSPLDRRTALGDEPPGASMPRSEAGHGNHDVRSTGLVAVLWRREP
jgi:hypothetical protein